MTQVSSLLPAPFFVLRTPLLPWQTFEAWSGEGVTAPGEAGWREAQAGLRTRLAELLRRPDLLEALFLASPDLVEALPKWLEAPDSEKGARCERGLVRYFARMCGRPTPFGLFAGCSRGRVGATTSLQLGSRNGHRRHTRLDMDYLCTLAEELAKDEVLRASLLYRPNSSLYEAGGRLRYAEGVMKARARSYHLVAVDQTPYLLETLQRAEGGATLSALAEALVDEEVSLEEAQAYLHELVASQVLVAELTPAVTGPEPIHEMLGHLSGIAGGAEAAEVLGKAQEALAAIDGGPLGVDPETYRGIAEDLRRLPAKVELNRLFQTDLVKEAPEAELGRDLLAEVLKGIEVLHRLDRSGGSRSGPLERFRDAFLERYEGREVPLMEALDEEGGVGFGGSRGPAGDTSPLLEGLAFPEAGTEAGSGLSGLDLFLLKKLRDLGQAPVLKLEVKDLEPYFSKQPQALAASVSVMGQVLGGPEGTPRFLFSGLGGPSGANLLGRFCHGDEALTEDVRAYLREEEAHRPEAIHAEVVHLPEGRIGNVLLRPLLRGYEIPFLGRSGAPEDRQLPLTDLLVSVREGRIVLRSRREGREVLPRLTTAHNYTYRSLGVYRFLCMLAHQGVAGGLGWSWGALERLPHLPRVELGGLVLSVARWSVEVKSLKAASEAKGFERWEAFRAWRAAQALPRHVFLGDGDNRLPLDLENPLMVDSLLDLVKGRGAFTLEEFFPAQEGLVAEDGEGRYTHEVVIPMTAARSEGQGAPTPAPAHSSGLPRTFLPGSEWLYLKLYGGASALDQVLREEVPGWVAEAKASGAATGWFFIRYGDPDWHLRLRFHGDPGRLASEVLPALSARVADLQARGLIRRLVVDSYERELERYGGDAGMPLSERLFEVDSEAVLALLEAYPGDAGADARWRLCAKGMEDLLVALGLDAGARLETLRHLQAGFLREFGGPGPLERQLGDRFRKEKGALERLLRPGGLPDGDPLAPGLEILEARAQRLEPLGAALQALPDLPLQDLAGSYLHMHANRLLRGAHRAQELVLYDFLHRIHESRAARERRAQPAATGTPSGD